MHQHDHAHGSHRPPLSLVILAVLLLAGLGILGRLVAPQVQAPIDPSQETVEARVIEVVEQGALDQGGVQQPYQRLRLEILTGQRAGRARIFVTLRPRCGGQGDKHASRGMTWNSTKLSLDKLRFFTKV